MESVGFKGGEKGEVVGIDNRELDRKDFARGEDLFLAPPISSIVSEGDQEAGLEEGNSA